MTRTKKVLYPRCIQGSLGQVILVLSDTAQVSLAMPQIEALGIIPSQIPDFDDMKFRTFYQEGYGENRMLRGWLHLNARRLEDAGIKPRKEGEGPSPTSRPGLGHGGLPRPKKKE